MEILTNFNTLMDKGGPVMWVIFLAAGVAIVMLIERLIQVHRWASLAANDQQLAHDAPFSAFKAWSGDANVRGDSPMRSVLRQVHWDEVGSKNDLTQQINALIAELMPRLDGLLPTIAVLGTLLPMLGLLGTVTGMINVFEVIALHGTGNPQEMAFGISQALLTTASGLVIAIPVIFAHHIVVQRLQLVLATTEQSLLVVINKAKF